ncbi:MAG: fumarylacetoacetase, partial [Gemmatimonadota bacterium]|nr:fumarylacetoacetase [Gemmatimonadota bacterium]
MSDRCIDVTHDPAISSWIESANDGGTDFPIQNLPLGIFSVDGSQPHAGVAIGDRVLDIAACIDAGLLENRGAARACVNSTLNALMSLDQSEMREFRRAVSEILRSDTEQGARARPLESRILHRISDVVTHLPVRIGDYTDFYASVHHATNVGSMFRPDNPLLPNYKYVPIGYHGRASSIVASGAEIRRPSGQTKPADADLPSFGPTKMLDYESELGFFVRVGNSLGEAVSIDDAGSRIFGFCLVNDWSARDIQAWEYQPLGPFLAKNFATTLGPWIVTAEAAEPYRIAVSPRPQGDPEPLHYLQSEREAARGAISAYLEVHLASRRMRDEGIPPVMLSRAPFAGMYWTAGQMLAHHASNGCNMRPGDLLASGTVSGETPDSHGCLLELTWR